MNPARAERIHILLEQRGDACLMPGDALDWLVLSDERNDRLMRRPPRRDRSADENGEDIPPAK